MGKQKINIKERVSEGEIDLSMSDLQDVPVKDIAIFKKATSLDLSNNHLKSLPANFATLSHLTKLDLSKNQLAELPENFGDLVKLKHLDLYQNQLQYLPLSFSKLKALKWLDLKDNPLVPAVAKVAGPCLDAQQCQSCAKDIISFFSQVQEQVASDIQTREKQRQKQLEANQQKQMENKKNKKKDKSKQKKENGPVATKESISKMPSKKPKRPISFEKHPPKVNPMFGTILALFLLVTTSLFILTSVKFRYTVVLEETCVDLFNRGVATLPPAVQEYAESAGDYVKTFHQRVGNYTLGLAFYTEEVNSMTKAYETVSGYFKTLLEVVKEQYKKYVT